jgi:hypothetical protein
MFIKEPSEKKNWNWIKKKKKQQQQELPLIIYC